MTTPAELARLVDVERLPARVQDIVAVIGLEETWRLLTVRGGRYIYVPASTDCPTVLYEILSPGAVAALCDQYHGCTLELPTVHSIENQIRDAAIVAGRAAGKTVMGLAAEFGLSRRRVQQILNGRGDLADGDDPAPAEAGL